MGAVGLALTSAARPPLAPAVGPAGMRPSRCGSWVVVKLEVFQLDCCDRGATESAGAGRASLLLLPVTAGAITDADARAGAVWTASIPSRCLPSPLSPLALAPLAAAASGRELYVAPLAAGAGEPGRKVIASSSESESETTRRFDNDLRFGTVRFDVEQAVESASPAVSGSDARRSAAPVVVWRRSFFDALPADVDGLAALVAGRDSTQDKSDEAHESVLGLTDKRWLEAGPTSLPLLALTVNGDSSRR